jgi:hypothetical protein
LTSSSGKKNEEIKERKGEEKREKEK